eukprot:CAMPEP_0170629284 /NCGR_PEP_ID=MMETSP0224-20130122/33257_1 /TAXON_ID=285029 /ORGANISM="Togula jolla, Strain CCCM 725" /LENGTH=85 /DNA_ID=CAMNT_0010957009 /DNA_START=212 /DNA_END=465 /DNA_ORIENTATION=-
MKPPLDVHLIPAAALRPFDLADVSPEAPLRMSIIPDPDAVGSTICMTMCHLELVAEGIVVEVSSVVRVVAPCTSAGQLNHPIFAT